MMGLKTTLLFLFIAFFHVLKSQALFHKNLGGSGDDIGYFIEPTSDGGWIVTGTTTSFGAGSTDIFLVKLDNQGNIEWQRTYGQTGAEESRTVRQTSDGGYVVGGKTGGDFYVFKVNASGTQQWSRRINGGGEDYVVNLIVTADGGYAFAGDVYTSLHFGFIARLDSDGTLLWARRVNNNSDNEAAYGIAETPDEDLIITGYTFSTGPGDGNGWRLRFDVNGNLIGQHFYGTTSGSGRDGFYSIIRTNDDNYIMTRNIDNRGAGGRDIWVLKTDLNGNIIWSKAYGGTGHEEGFSIQNTIDNGYIVAGMTNSFGSGNFDAYLLKLSEDGSLQWSKTFGSTSEDRAFSIAANTDGSFTFTGYTYGTPSGDRNIFLVGINANGANADCNTTTPATVVTNFTPGVTTTARAVTNITTNSTITLTQGTPAMSYNLSCTPLPVVLTFFEGELMNQSAHLTWTTASEAHVSHFILEKSVDGTSFTKTGKIEAVGNTIHEMNYHFTDNTPEEINYYRLQIVDRDSSVSYSRVIRLEGNVVSDVFVYPNPADQSSILEIHLMNISEPEAVVSFTDLNGKLLWKKIVSIQDRENLYLPAAGLQPGIYLITVFQNDSKIIKKLVVL